MKAPNLLALSAAVLMSAGSLAAFQQSVGFHPASGINEIEVVELQTITVTPTAQERRFAAMLPLASVAEPIAATGPVAAVDLATITVTPSSEERANALLFADAPTPDGSANTEKSPAQTALIEPQLAVPYYSFGHTAALISKE